MDLTTRQRVLALALARFNERGLEGVAIRELARELGLSPGNVSYHFPKKEALVAALMEELRELNDATIGPLEQVETLEGFLERYRRVFENQHAYRFIPRSLATIVRGSDETARRYRSVEKARRASLAAALERLRDAGELERTLDEEAIARIVGLCTLIARFWLSEAELSHPRARVDSLIEHYLSLIAHALSPHVARHARRTLEPYLSPAARPR